MRCKEVQVWDGWVSGNEVVRFAMNAPQGPVFVSLDLYLKPPCPFPSYLHQVIPWVLTDSNFIRCPSQRLDPQKTVFVGALHGMLNSEALAYIFNDLFGGVVYAGKRILAFIRQFYFERVSLCAA